MQTLPPSALTVRHRGSARSADLATGRRGCSTTADLLIDRDLRVMSRLFPRFAALTLAVPFFDGGAVAGTVSVAIG